MKTDVLIIGGGVIGASIAHQLAKYNMDIILVEKASDVCMGTSKANSAMIHSGFNIKGDTLKGKLALEANKVIKQLCEDLDVGYEKPLGSITVGFEEADLERMQHTLENGIKNGIKGMKLLDQKELHEMEPHLNPDAKYGLYEPETGIINPFEFTVALAENAVLNGAKVLLETEVLDVIVEDKQVKGVKTSNGDIEAKVIINAAGLYADKIAGMVEDIDFEIKPRKGEYFLYDKKWRGILNHPIYSAPTKVSKRMIIVPTVDGNLLAGSNAETIDDTTDLATSSKALNGIYGNMISHLFPQLPRMGDVITTFAGLRAASTNEDFIIEPAKTVKGFINVAGIQSPGLTSAPAIATMVEGLVREAGIMTAGAAQNYVNLEGYIPGKEVVILGSGDIGLIMARRLTLEGVNVKGVLEVMPYSTGLVRNRVQCLDDFGIPLLLSHTITEIHGKDRVEGVTIAKVDERIQPIAGTEQYVSCDTLLLSVGLIPENELTNKLGCEMDQVTKGPVVNEKRITNTPWVFAAGNVLHVHDLVDNVTQEAEIAGKAAAALITGKMNKEEKIVAVTHDKNIGYVVPQHFDALNNQDKVVKFFLRVKNPDEDIKLVVKDNANKELLSLKKSIVEPGTMITFNLPRQFVTKDTSSIDISIAREQAE